MKGQVTPSRDVTTAFDTTSTRTIELDVNSNAELVRFAECDAYQSHYFTNRKQVYANTSGS